jgi:ribosomal protein L7/L12
MEALAGAILGLVLGFTLAILIGRAIASIARLERKVDALLRHAGLDVARLAEEEVAALVRAGKKIDAIKLYREYTGCGLAEAKARVDAMG